MLVIILEAAILIALLKIVTEEELSMLTAILVAFGAAIGANLLAKGFVMALAPALGIGGILLGISAAGGIVAVALAFIISALCGVEIKRAFLVGILFVAAHIGLSVVFQLMLSRPT